MINYVPFLKSKSNEFNAIGSLPLDVAGKICPFFDLHRKSSRGYTEEEYIELVEKVKKSAQKHLSKVGEFYIDDYDMPSDVFVEGMHGYYYLLDQIGGLPVIPVVALDRSDRRCLAISELKEGDRISSQIVAFRVTLEEFEDYGVVENEIVQNVANILSGFKQTDLILDCRMCRNLDAASMAEKILDFSRQFCRDYSVRRVVVTGSSIPASIKDVMPVNTEKIISRTEVAIFRQLSDMHDHAELVFGDYTVVSPDYSDADLPPQMLQNVMTAKLAYSFADKHYLVRGAGIKTNGSAQYFQMARSLCQKDFFRTGYSLGEKYLAQKARSEGANCTPNSVIKPSVISHVVFAAREGVA
jgi:hypothetical protein